MRPIRWLLSVFFLTVTCFSTVPTLACTIFTITIGDSVLFGSNEDSDLEGTFITFVPADGPKHGYVFFSYDENDHPWDGATLGGMNDHGLCFDENWVPSKRINASPERPSFPPGSFYNYFYMFKHYATVTEVETLFTTYGTSYDYNMSLQAHWADASGDAAIASVGPGGNWTFTRRDANISYLISTNWNRAFSWWEEPDVASSRERYNTSQALLANITQEGDLTVERCRDVLDAVHFEGFTQYSHIFDLANRDIYLYFHHDFDKVLKINLDEELAKGYRKHRIADLFRSRTSQTQPPGSTRSTSTSSSTSTSDRSPGFMAALMIALLALLAFKRYLSERKGRNHEK